MWYVQLAAIWHWNWPLMLSFFLSIPFLNIFFFYLASIKNTEWSTISACRSLMCSFKRGNTEGTNSSKNCV